MSQTLDELSALQLTVGEELLGESRGQNNYIYVLTALQIGLVMLAPVLAQAPKTHLPVRNTGSG